MSNKKDKNKDQLSPQDFVFKTVASTYRLLVAVAEESGIKKKEYQVTLRLLAVNLYQWAGLCRAVDKDGFSYVTTSTSGDEIKKANPDADQMDRAFKRVMVGLKGFGWDPASAASVEKDEGDNQKVKLFNALALLMGGGELEDDFTE